MTLTISDITRFTLQDFPNHTACIVWFAGCNMRCKYCHNTEFLDKNSNFLEEDYVLEFLKKRIGLIDGVVLSGGECTLNTELLDFIIKIRNMGFKVKIDTNGLNYNLIDNLINKKIIDFIALDFKAPFDKFFLVTKTNLYNDFYKTLNLIVNNKDLDSEIRTTVHTSFLQENDLNEIIEILDNIGYDKKYFIQNYRNDNNSVKLEDQPYIIDINKIKKPKNFDLGFRNFF